jgi:hypothetical protein
MAKSSAFTPGFSEPAFRDAWLAGLYEGEGSCSLVHGRLQVQIKMTDLDVLERALEIAGVGRIYGPYRRSEAWKPCWTFIVYREEDAQALLGRLRPYLLSRRGQQIDDALVGWQLHRASLPDDASRFWAKVVEVDGHQMWTGAIQEGYGRVWVGGPRSDPTLSVVDRKRARPKQDLAHRAAWRLVGRELPARVNLRNGCGELACVDPDHWVRADLVCPKGHAITGDNIVLAKNGKYVKRACRRCCNSAARAAKEARRGA